MTLLRQALQQAPNSLRRWSRLRPVAWHRCGPLPSVPVPACGLAHRFVSMPPGLTPKVNEKDDDDELDYDSLIDNLFTADDLEYREQRRPDGDLEEDFFGSARKVTAIPTWESDYHSRQSARREEDRAYRLKQAKISADLDSRKGRLWTERWVITDEEWMSNQTWDDIEDWKPELATRKSLESLVVFQDGVPTLQQLSNLPLPPSLTPHPAHGSPSLHASSRKRRISKQLRTSIQIAVQDDLIKILNMNTWTEKQDAVDALFEVAEERVREREPVLAKLPNFGDMVEHELEQLLKMIQSRMKATAGSGTATSNAHIDTDNDSLEDQKEKQTKNVEKKDMDMNNIIHVMNTKKDDPVPVFMDLLKVRPQQQNELDTSPHSSSEDSSQTPSSHHRVSHFFTESNDAGVPNLIYPLNVHHNEGKGRMVEEWELAANKNTKRIMMRDAMKEAASKIVEATNCSNDEPDKDEEKGAARIFITGKRGVGKTAALAGLVASARMSGHIVVYHPDGDRLRKHGYYVEPCTYRTGLYNLPEIAKEFCEQLLVSHGEDLTGMTVAKDDMKNFLSEDQIERVSSKIESEGDNEKSSLAPNDDTDVASTSSIFCLNKLLSVGKASTSLSSGCYCTVIFALMSQTKKPFTIAMDEFNCYYDHGHYYHMDYDENVRKAIPLNKITIFKPFLDAMGLYPTNAGTEITQDSLLMGETSNKLMKWGSIIVALSESRAVRQTFTNALIESALAQSQEESHSRVHVVDIRRFSSIEVQHILYNFEITGVGRLRFDRGDTTLNPEEVEYLRMVSGGLGQPLMDACMLP